MSRRTESQNQLLQGQIDAVRAGRSTSIDLGESRLGESITEVPSELRQLKGLRNLYLGESNYFNLQAWVAHLPDLESIDASEIEDMSLPSWPEIRWGINAKTAFRNAVNPGQIYKIAIGADTSSDAIKAVFELGREEDFRLTELMMIEGVPIDLADNRESLRREWRAFGLISEGIDRFLESQPGLSKLDLFGCPLGRIPSAIRGLDNLDSLTLVAIYPEVIPDWLFQVPSLSSLDLSYNLLTDLPSSIARARKLNDLRLRMNPLTRIPSGIWELESLEVLYLAGCPIEEVPSDVLRLKRLSQLGLSKSGFDLTQGSIPDQLLSPPPEIAIQGLEAIRRYWSQEQDAGFDYLTEAKLLIVGESGAGKTSLAKKLVNPEYALDEGEDSTAGINVLDWQFPASVRIRDRRGERLIEREFRANVWDFGGQEIYHSTHQFFLTKRSVYALVADERREDTDFEYWLEVVNLLSGGSPLIIVQNRKHGRQQGIDLGAIRKRYPNMCGAHVVDLADNSGLDAMVAKFRRELEQLPHIGTPLPKTWRDVRVALEADPRNHIDAAEFFGICQANGFTDRDDMRQLGGYLHDLGICLFFQDDEELSEIVILNPEWGTRAVYQVLDDPHVAAALGVFCRDDLRRIWNDASYDAMHSKLLRLMVKFGLCFPVPASETFIAPQLLIPSQPSYRWDVTDNLVLRYVYDVMPKGIAQRLIVALHDLIVPGDFLWRSGAVFEYDSSKAEVTEQYRRRLLTVRIHGGDPRVLLGIIDRELGLIHRSYPGIRFEKVMPCHCPVCSATSEPGTFAVGELESFARTRDLIQCRVSRQLLDPAELLRTLWPSPELIRSRGAERETPQPQPEVFISYKWGGVGTALADEIQAAMTERGVTVTRDKDEIAYRDSIRDFMRRLGAGKCVIVILEHAYLQSKNCMFELTEIAARPEFRSRVFPVVMRDAGIFDPVVRLGYVKYWEDKRAELDRTMKGVGQEFLQGIREELDLYETIRNTIAAIMELLGDMNALTPEMHRDTEFSQLYTSLASVLP